MNLAKLAEAATAGIIEAAAQVDKTVAEFKADQNNTAKAVTVAQGLLSLTELLASIAPNL